MDSMPCIWKMWRIFIIWP